MPYNAVAFYNRIVNSVSFSTDLYRLRRALNSRIDSSESIEEFPPSHPQGFIKEFKRRRISIVESYLAIHNYLESDQYTERVRALELLQEQTTHSKNLAMPLNTARVQLALMKEAVKQRENRRRQLELLQDFTICSYGQPSVIRRYLDELNIIELPENGKRLAEMGMGWDRHVHDNSSYGRKNPTQLVIDAFIKGISRITVAFNLLDGRGHLQELLDAALILGVGVDLGVEFSVLQRGYRFHFMYLLPPFARTEELNSFFDAHGESLLPFSGGLRENQANRIRAIRTMIEKFNLDYLPILNEGYVPSGLYFLNPLRIQDAEDIVPIENLNRMHLGEVLYKKYKPVLFRRVLLAKSRMEDAKTRYDRREISGWDFNNIVSRYEALRQGYVELNPENLRETYFSNPQVLGYETVFDNLPALAETLHKTGGLIKIIHPLEYGIDAAYSVLMENGRSVDVVEVYNLYDSIRRPIDEIIRFAAFVNILNSGDPLQVRPFLVGHEITVAANEIDKRVASFSRKPLVPVCGSDATGRSSSMPGMGFIFESAIGGKNRNRYLEKHFGLPEFISRIISARGAYVATDAAATPVDRIISMGKASKFVPNKVGDEHEMVAIPLRRALRYLNPKIKNICVSLVGFIFAYYTLGLGYAIVWFAITGVRHVITDLLSRRGSRLRDWTWKAVNVSNISYSLFWTGLSVPLLAFVKHLFDTVWPFGAGTIGYNLAQFFAINFVNGFYLMGHNKLRGFDRGVIWANFFRSIFAWPFASFVAPLGDLAMIPTIVQSKFWSDFVGGIIEGSGKFARSVKLTRRDLSEIIEGFRGMSVAERYTAAVDLLHIFEHEPRARNSLREILFGHKNYLDLFRDAIRREHREPRKRFTEFEALLSWFGHQSNYQKLSDFVISNYRREHALILVDLIARQYLRFGDWLTAQRRLAYLEPAGKNASKQNASGSHRHDSSPVR
ncbi:MAG TPA: hypothetical protein VMV68_03655 [Spirochaetia bacterium]|nr:hypothetical protein [Spirochaetia bacterium]